MKYYLFCAGGSGAKILEGIVHLCAAGLGPGEIGGSEINFLMIDPDAGGGSLDGANDVINKYAACETVFGGKIGKERFFATKFTPLSVAAGAGVAGAWSPVNAGQHFDEVLGYGVLNPDQKNVADLLFTASERNMHMGEGFLGHPSLGAAALSLLGLYQGAQPWMGIQAKLARELAAGEVRVVIAGSVFGGTGASVFSPLANWLKRTAGPHGNNLKVAAVALVPYFSFANPAAGELGPDSRKFGLATRAAAKFYDQMRELGMLSYTSMFWLGDDADVQVPRCSGGLGQRNPAHFVELMAAQAALDFLVAAHGAIGGPGGVCCYAGTRGDNANTVEWQDFPRVGASVEERATLNGKTKREILRFLTCGSVHAQFYLGLFRGGPTAAQIKPETITWYKKMFLDKNWSLKSPTDFGHLERLSDFAKRTIWWWSELHSTTPGRMRLLNPQVFKTVPQQLSAWLERERLKNVDYPDDLKKQGSGLEDFHSRTFARGFSGGADGPAPTYLALLAHAATSFVRAHYGL